MEVKSKQTRGHHLPCLSGLSLAPLLSSSSDCTGERSLPNSAHSLPFGSCGSSVATASLLDGSTDIAGSAPPLHNDSCHNTNSSKAPIANNNNSNDNNNNNNNQAANAAAAATAVKPTLRSKHFGAPLQLPNAPPTSIFFPPLPAKISGLGSNQPSRAHKGARHQDGALVQSNKSPMSADINMKFEQEFERKACSMQHLQQQQQHHHHQQPPLPMPPPPPSLQNRRSQQHQVHALPNLKPPFVQQTKLNSPLPVPSKSLSDFNENSHPFPNQQFKLMSLSNELNATSNGQQNVHDDNYHLYHEPIDPDDEQPSAGSSLTQVEMSPKQVSLSSADNSPFTLKQNFNDLINNQQASPFFNSSTGTAASNTTNNQMASQDFNSSSATNQLVIANKSPTTSILLHSSNNPNQPNTSNLSFSNRTCSAKHKNDISAEIYFSYVSLKSNDRTNSRSRSYHGPKNTCLNSTSQQSPYVKDATKNLSSSSVLDLPISPTSFTSTMIRDHCVRELIETESNYVHALEMILTSFAKPLESFLRKEDYQSIFGHIKYFHHIHFGLQAELVKAALRSYNKEIPNLGSTSHSPSVTHKSNLTTSNPTTPTLVGNIPQFLCSSPLLSPTQQEPQVKTVKSTTNQHRNLNLTTFKISSCFLNMREKFLKYGEYCASLSKTQALLDELSARNEGFAAQLDRCQQDANDGKFKLRDLLSLPMQRILKYHLLLAQLIKNTSSTNDDYYGLKRAYETMVDLGQYINEVKRDTEAILIINKIEQTITGLNMPPNTQLTDYGRFIQDGFVRVKSPLDAKTKVPHDSKLKIPNDIKLKQKRYFFVFDKVMLLCKGTNYQYKEALVLSEFEIEIENENAPKHLVKDKWNYNFNLIHNSDPANVYSFSAKTLENKLKLVEAIQQAMDNIRPAACRDGATNHEFLMHTFDKASSCDHCGKLLLGLYYQGYRCRICFSSVHKKCIAHIKPCGPPLPMKTSNMMTMSRNRCINEPKSPSMLSNCSEEDGGGANGACRSYVNFILNDYPWFVGRMERDTAEGLLENMPSGTFLVRVSPKHNHSYVISLNYNMQVKHMRILVSEDNRLYLSENRHFKSVIELVSWYEKNSLIESFPNLYAHLAHPYKAA